MPYLTQEEIAKLYDAKVEELPNEIKRQYPSKESVSKQENFCINKNKRKWWQYRKITKKDYGSSALLLFLAGWLIKGLAGDIFNILGFGFGIAWLVLTMRQRKINKAKKVVTSDNE